MLRHFLGACWIKLHFQINQPACFLGIFFCNLCLCFWMESSLRWICKSYRQQVGRFRCAWVCLDRSETWFQPPLPPLTLPPVQFLLSRSQRISVTMLTSFQGSRLSQKLLPRCLAATSTAKYRPWPIGLTWQEEKHKPGDKLCTHKHTLKFTCSDTHVCNYERTHTNTHRNRDA